MKSAMVFSLMVDGSGSRGSRIFGRLRPVRIVRKRSVIGTSKRTRPIRRQLSLSNLPLKRFSRTAAAGESPASGFLQRKQRVVVNIRKPLAFLCTSRATFPAPLCLFHFDTISSRYARPLHPL